MKELNIKKFSLFFCLLIIFQEANAFARINRPESAVSVINEIKEENAVVSREKRTFGAVLIAVSLASASLDVYKQYFECDHFTPGLSGKITDAKNLQESNNDRIEAINTAWGPIESKEAYVERLASDIDIIRAQIVEIDSLQADLITLLDQSILDKLNALEKTLENQIDANNVTDIETFEDLEAKFYTAGQFALTMSLKLTPVVLYLGFEAFPKLRNYYTNRAARNWAAANPDKATKVLGDYAKNKGLLSQWTDATIGRVTRSLQTQWLNYQIRHPAFQTALNRFNNMAWVQAAGRGLKTVTTALVAIGKVATAGFLIGYEIFLLLEFKDQCEEKLAVATEGLAALEQQASNLTEIENSMAELSADADLYYDQMMDNLTNSEIVNFLYDVVELGENAMNQSANLIQATADVQTYINEINETSNTEARDEELNKMLSSALSQFNFKLACVHTKLAIISGVTGSCADGGGTFDELFEEAQTQERASVTDACLDNGYMTKDEIEQITTETMVEYGVNTICIRNSVTRGDLACSNWYNDMDDETNAESVGVSDDDLQYFISQCEPGPVSSSVKSAVCSMKAEGKTSDEVIATYYKLDSTALTEAYNNCNLTEAQKDDICTSKFSGHELAAIQADYALYSAEMVEDAYNSCQLRTDIDPIDKGTICLFVNNGLGYLVEVNFGNKYDAAALADAKDDC